MTPHTQCSPLDFCKVYQVSGWGYSKAAQNSKHFSSDGGLVSQVVKQLQYAEGTFSYNDLMELSNSFC